MLPTWRRLLAIAVASTASSLLVGCEGLDSPSAQADRRVEPEIRNAGVLLDPDDRAQALLPISNNAELSNTGKARVKSLLAAAQNEAALQQLQEVDRNQSQVIRLVYEIQQVVDRVDAINTAVDGYRQYNPEPARKAVADALAAAQGGAGRAAWIEHNGAPLPTLAHAKQEISRLEGEISKLQTQINDTQARRTRLLEEAEKAAADSANLKGAESVEAFKRVSNVRREAADLSVEVDKLNAALQPLQADLSIAQAQEKAVSKVIAEYQDQARQIDATWREIQAKIADQQKLAVALVNGSPELDPAEGHPTSITGKAAQLVKFLEAEKAAYQAAASHFSAAADSYAGAASAAEALLAEMRQRSMESQQSPLKAAWDRLAAAFDPSMFRFQEASAQNALGNLHAAQASTLAQRQRVVEKLTATLQKAGIQIPADIQDNALANDLSAARSGAAAAFTSADELLQNVESMPSADEPRRSSAKVLRIVVLYAWSQLERNAGNEEQARIRLDAARTVLQEAQASNIRLPILPSDLLAAGPRPQTPAPQAE